VKNELNYNNILEVMVNTCADLRDTSARQAALQLKALIATSRLNKSQVMAAFEAVQRYKAIVYERYRLKNQIRKLRDGSLQQA
jgi:hypothetical protein